MQSSLSSAVQPAVPGEPKVWLMGVGFAAITEPQCVAHIMNAREAGRGGWVITPNVDILRQFVTNAELRAFADEADLLVADGMPLVWASRLQGTPLPQRVAGSNLILSVSEAAAQHGRSMFLLGGDEGMAEAAAQVLRNRWPELRIAGIFCPPMGFERDPGQMEAIRQAVVQSGADIVFVALGFPKQERLIRNLRPLLPNAWWLGVGISFSFVCGRVRRAPRWVQALGLEWVHRLMQEPRRLIRRYLIDDVPFAVRLLWNAAASRRRRL